MLQDFAALGDVNWLSYGDHGYKLLLCLYVQKGFRTDPEVDVKEKRGRKDADGRVFDIDLWMI